MIETKPLGEVVRLRKGKKAPRVFDNPSNGALPYLQIDEVRGAVAKRFAQDPNGVEVAKDDLCIVWDGANAGIIGYGVSGFIGSTVARMRLVDPPDWETPFIGRLLQGKFRELNDQAHARGATIPHVDKMKLEQICLPKLAPDEQRQIVAILDKADGIRRKREESIILTDSLLKSAFLQMFGDPAKNPKRFRVERIECHLSKERNGTQSGPFGSSLKRHEYTDSGIPVWGVENVQANRFMGTAKLFISEEKYEQLRRYSVRFGDVLISRAGTVGRMCIARPVVERSIIGTNLVRVALDPQSLLAEYFVALFTYLPHRLEALKANEKASAFTFLNPKKLRGIEIPIPPKSLQKCYRDFVNNTESLSRQNERQLEGLDGLFVSLSRRAFRSRL